MNKLKASLVTLGIISSSVITFTMGVPCPVGHTPVYIDREGVCILKTHNNLKAALYADITSAKKDNNNKLYDIEVGNWNIFWETLEKEVKAQGLTATQFNEMVNGDKQVIIDFLNPNK